MLFRIITLLCAGSAVCASGFGENHEPWVVYDGFDGPGNGKHIVLISGDDEYRSEESLPQLGKILAVRHGFRCTVLFAIDPESGAITPDDQTNIPGLKALDDADLMILFVRFRELPDDQMKHIMDYTNSGKPVIGIRTSTHAFFYREQKDSPYATWSWNSKHPQGGYGREVLGETWIAHYGHHNHESTRGIIAPGMKDHPIVRGVDDVWGPSDVYEVTELNGDSQPVLLGEVLLGMEPDDEPNKEKPPLPVAWIKTYTGTAEKPARVFTTTMGHSYDFKSEGFRRLLVNAVYWCLGMENEIPAKASVDTVGEYNPSGIGFGTHRDGVMPSEHALE